MGELCSQGHNLLPDESQSAQMDHGDSIIGCCITLRNNVSLLLSDLQRWLAGIRHPGSDLKRLPSELASLHLSVGALQISCGQTSSMPITLRSNLESVMLGCGGVVQEMRDVLFEDTVASPDMERSAMKRMLPALEAHRSAIQIALEFLFV